MELQKIDPARLVPLDLFTGDVPLRVDLAYARDDAFCGKVYRDGARLWLHEDLAAIVVLAARLAGERYGLRLVVYDGLRTVAAQEKMLDVPSVRAHPQWLAKESRVLSPPGYGGHPRGMAVDVSLETMHGELLDMGTAFDELPVNGSGPDVNRANRAFAGLTPEMTANRAKLDDVMMGAAQKLRLPLWPLSVEWWDYRMPSSIYDAYAPLDEADLPPQMRMTDKVAPERPDMTTAELEDARQSVLRRISFGSPKAAPKP